MIDDKKRIYADYAATAPLCSAAKRKIISLLDLFGNPSSAHQEGRTAQMIIEKARRQIAKAIRAEPEEIFFTSGGSEANSLAMSWEKTRVSPIEHASVIQNPCAQTGTITVDHHGTIQPFTAQRVALMLVNNEVGTVQPIRQLMADNKTHDVRNDVTSWLHVDAVQAVGHIPVDVKALGADTLSLSGHKFGAPKGVGALYIAKQAQHDHMLPLIWGGGQERGIRSGTENVLGIASMGEAIAWAVENMDEYQYHSQRLRDKLIDGIAAIRGAELTGHPTNRAPGIASFVFNDVEGHALAAALDEDGIAVSAGPACHSGSLKPSHVLLAMGYAPKRALGALRISIGWGTSENDVDKRIVAVDGQGTVSTSDTKTLTASLSNTLSPSQWWFIGFEFGITKSSIINVNNAHIAGTEIFFNPALLSSYSMYSTGSSGNDISSNVFLLLPEGNTNHIDEPYDWTSKNLTYDIQMNSSYTYATITPKNGWFVAGNVKIYFLFKEL